MGALGVSIRIPLMTAAVVVAVIAAIVGTLAAWRGASWLYRVYLSHSF